VAATKPARQRAKISVTIDPSLLSAVDHYVQSQPDLDRSKVMERALKDWYRTQQDEAMIAQYEETQAVGEEETAAWRDIRRAAARRNLEKRPR